MKNHIIISLLFLFICCSTDKNNKLTLEKINGLWYDQRTNDVFSGLYVDTLSEGKIKTKGSFTNGLKDGLWIYWYFLTNQKKSEGSYVDGIRHGEWIEWYRNGNVKNYMKYSYGIPIGEWYELNEYGKRQLGYCFFTNGNGFWKKLYENGLERESGYIQDGKKNREWKWYYDDGKKKWVGNYENGKRVGEWIYWSNDGTLELQFTGSEIDEIISQPVMYKQHQDYFDLSREKHYDDVGDYENDLFITHSVNNE
jgi:antitoxin component YwqK of YwqJK toxin-antitoxin module